MSSYPTDWVREPCEITDHLSALWEDKIYIFGGTIWMDGRTWSGAKLFSNTSTSPVEIANSHLRILDFTKSFDLSNPTTNIESALPLPPHVPPSIAGHFFPVDSKIKYFGGHHVTSILWNLTNPGDPPLTPREPTAAGLWTFDISTQTWEPRARLGPDVLSVSDPIATTHGYDVQRKRGWVFGGVQSTRYAIGEADFFVMGEYNKSVGVRLPFRQGLRQEDINYNSVWDGTKSTLTTLPIPKINVPTSGTAVGWPIKPHTWTYKQNIFIPNYGKSGILLAFGGIELEGGTNPQQPGDMRSAYIYDISSHTWYLQPLTSEPWGPPPPRVHACTVGAPSADGSSYNIYVYGGLRLDFNSNGQLDMKGAGSGIVYVLSLPAFHWTAASVSGPDGGVFYHSCEKLRERYMVSYGGRWGDSNSRSTCQRVRSGNGGSGPYRADGKDSRKVNIFDMWSMSWTGKYEYEAEEGAKLEYRVPQSVASVIGGNSSGGAIFTTPRGGWSHPDLSTIFSLSPPNNGTPIEPPPSADPPGPSDTPTGTTSRTSPAVIAGSVIGGLIGGAVLFWLVYYFLVMRRQNRWLGGERAVSEMPGSSGGWWKRGGGRLGVAEMGDTRRKAELEGDTRSKVELEGDLTSRVELGDGVRSCRESGRFDVAGTNDGTEYNTPLNREYVDYSTPLSRKPVGYSMPVNRETV